MDHQNQALQDLRFIEPMTSLKNLLYLNITVTKIAEIIETTVITVIIAIIPKNDDFIV